MMYINPDRRDSMPKVPEKKPEVVKLPDGSVISKSKFDSDPGDCILLPPVEDDIFTVYIAVYGFEVPATE